MIVIRLPDWTAHLTRGALSWMLLRISPRHVVGRFTVTDATGDDQASPLLARTVEALKIIERTDPRRWRRMGEDVRQIIILGTLGSDGEQWRHPWAIILGAEHVRSSCAEAVALTLVHEATHARLMRAGVGYEERIRTRVERACVGEEMGLARRLPDAERWLAHVRCRCLDEAHWTDAAMRSRREAARAAGRGAPPA